MRQLRSRRPELNPYIVDAALGALVASSELLWLLATEGSAGRGPDGLLVASVLCASGALTWRRRAPGVVLLVVWVCFYAVWALQYPSVLQLAAALATWSAVVRPSRVPLYAIAIGLVPVIPLVQLQDAPPDRVGDAVAAVLLVAGTALVAHNVRLRRERRQDEARRSEAEIARAASEERLRIARELHDIVAHALSIVTVQAGVAAHVIDEQPEEAKRMLETVRACSREALEELRRLLGALRDESVDHEPAPRLDAIDALAESVRSAGVAVSVRRCGDCDGMPRALEVTVYRIVQEALTNVLKHAEATHVKVTVECGATAVGVSVFNDGRPSSATAVAGHGLVGMRERVAAFGGQIHAGPTVEGFQVTVTVPYHRS